MRTISLLLGFAVCLFGQQDVVFEGTATHAITHEPLSGVHILLIAAKDINDGLQVTYGAESDRAGHFTIGDLKAGAYLLWPEKRGFAYGQAKKGMVPFPGVSFKPGEHVADFRLEMMPQAAISGRVVDDYGDPLQQVGVYLEAAGEGQALVPGLFGNGHRSETDERGVFRISGMPGRYYVRTNGVGRDLQEKRTDGTHPVDYRETYYPSSASKDGATVVETQPGAEISGIEIRMLPRPALRGRTFAVSGTVKGLPEGEAAAVYLRQVFDDRRKGGERHQVYVGGSVPTFILNGVSPGRHVLSASVAEGELATVPMEIIVGAADVSGLELRLGPSAVITGTLAIAGEPAGPLTDKWKIRLQPPSLGVFGDPSTIRTAAVEPDGSFRMTGVPAARVQVRLELGAPEAYIKSTEFDGAAGDGQFEFQGRDAHLKVTVSRNGASLTGKVLNRGGEPMVNGVAMVVLIEGTDLEALDRLDSKNQVRVSPDGKYELHGIRPGRYRLMAVDPFQSPDLTSPDLMKKAMRVLSEMEIKESDRIVRDIKVFAKEDLDGKEK